MTKQTAMLSLGRVPASPVFLSLETLRPLLQKKILILNERNLSRKKGGKDVDFSFTFICKGWK